MQEMLHQCFTSLAAAVPTHRAADLRLTLQDCRMGFNLAAGQALSCQLAAAELDQVVEDGATPEEIEARVGGGTERHAGLGGAGPHLHGAPPAIDNAKVRHALNHCYLQVRALQREQEEAQQLQEQQAQQQQSGGGRPATPPGALVGSRPTSPLRRSMSLFGGSSRPSTPGSSSGRPGTDAPGQPAGDGGGGDGGGSSPELLVPLRQVSLFLREAGLVPRVLSKLVTDQFHVSRPLAAPAGKRSITRRRGSLAGSALRALEEPALHSAHLPAA
jgi:hypothetical protein